VSGHTPGPWCVAGKETESGAWESLEVIQVVLPMHTVCFMTSDGQKLENARLIAAAPELLAMVKRYASECADCDGTGLMEFIGADQDIYEKECTQCADIRSLLARAEGRS